MKAEIKEMYSIEIPHRLEEYYPEDDENFGFSIRIMIGSDAGDRSESFDIFVCSPKWVRDNNFVNGCTWGRHVLVINTYDISHIKGVISSKVSACRGDNWLEIARQLNLFAAWEFENYQAFG